MTIDVTMVTKFVQKVTVPLVITIKRLFVIKNDMTKVQFKKELQLLYQPDGGVDPPTLRLRVSRSTD